MTERILLVEDDEELADALGEALTDLGHIVLVAHDGEHALTIVPGFLPTVAVLDLGLRGMSGLELAGRLRRALTRPPMLIALTGRTDVADKHRAAEVGFDAYLVKPVDLDAVLATLRRARDAG